MESIFNYFNFKISPRIYQKYDGKLLSLQSNYC